jgi:hypothetical protein
MNIQTQLSYKTVKKKNIILFFLLIISITVFTQNLVKNPGFENMYGCPDRITSIHFCCNWSSPTGGTPDYFSKKSANFSSGVPLNVVGINNPNSGESYAGIILYKKEIDYYEYLQGELITPLEKGKTYYVTFYYNCADISRYFVKEMGVYFVKNKISKKSFILNTNPNRKINNENIHQYSEMDNWVKFTAKYVAYGGEKYFIIGNLDKKLKVDHRVDDNNEKIPGIRNIAYYYIDDVCITAGKAFIDTKYNLQNIHLRDLFIGQKSIIASCSNIFKDNSNRFINKTKKTINKKERNFEILLLKYVADFLLINHNIVIEIGVYSDNSHNERHNIRLTTRRAKAVVNFLKRNGIKKSRLKYNGYGSQDQIASNETVEGRKKNNRIEFKIIKIHTESYVKNFEKSLSDK